MLLGERNSVTRHQPSPVVDGMEYSEKSVAIVDGRRRSGITLRSYQVECRCTQAITDHFAKQHWLDILTHVVRLIDIYCVARRGEFFPMREPELEILTSPECVEDGFTQSL